MSKELEAEIQRKGLTKPRITNDTIDVLMATVRYETWVVPGTATTVAVAILPMGEKMWPIAMEQSSPASMANFDAELGKTRAVQKVSTVAKDRLWELEGYALAKALAAAPKVDLEQEYAEVKDLELILSVSDEGGAVVSRVGT